MAQSLSGDRLNEPDIRVACADRAKDTEKMKVATRGATDSLQNEGRQKESEDLYGVHDWLTVQLTMLEQVVSHTRCSQLTGPVKPQDQ